MYEGYLSLEDKLSDYFHELDEETLGETTIRHLLTRSTGLKINKDKVTRLFKLGTNIEGKRPSIY